MVVQISSLHLNCLADWGLLENTDDDTLGGHSLTNKRNKSGVGWKWL